MPVPNFRNDNVAMNMLLLSILSGVKAELHILLWNTQSCVFNTFVTDDARLTTLELISRTNQT